MTFAADCSSLIQTNDLESVCVCIYLSVCVLCYSNLMVFLLWLMSFSIRSSVCARKPHFNSERDLRHPGVVPAQGHGGPRRHRLQHSLQEVLRGRTQVRPLWQQRSFCPQTVRPLVDDGAGHGPAAGFQLQLHRGEPERGLGFESHPERDRHGQRHHVADR